jgi:hypothetical protein
VTRCSRRRSEEEEEEEAVKKKKTGKCRTLLTVVHGFLNT